MIKNLILLCGQNQDNLVWLQKIGEKFVGKYKVHIHKYSHWDTGGEMDFEVELESISKKFSKISNYAVIAKSAGGLLALMAYKNTVFRNAEKIIVIGMPMNWAAERNIDYLSVLSNDNNIKYIQATNDPKGRYSELKKILSKKTVVRKYYSNNHGYRKIATICRHIDELLD
jgi:hypothetical protein